MNHLRWIKALLILFLLGLTACSSGPSDEESVAVMVALTQTSAAGATEVAGITAPEETEVPEESFPGDLQPLSPDECEQLAAFMVNRLPVPPVEQMEVAVEHEGETGGGCQALAVGTGEVFPDMMVVEEAMRGILKELGWNEDPTAPTCLGIGGWGPGASTRCYVQADAVCEVFVHVNPVDGALCPDDEPIFVCLERLDPGQIVHTVELTCARDTSPSAEPLESDLMRIEYAPGEIKTTVEGEVPGGGFDHYVLTAMGGQEMTVDLLNNSGNVLTPDLASLVIWGADGTVLISSHADAVTWTGELPITQDYLIDVKSISSANVPYILEVIIPPQSGAAGGDVFPVIEPFAFGEMQTIVLSGVPPMLPPDFPVEEGMPEIFPYFYSSEEGIYETSLDYGADCLGAGACHYGSMMGKVAESDLPSGSRLFPLDIGAAEKVDLSKNVQGYFIPSECGANCSDTQIFWTYKGYEYMVGLKASSLEDVRALAKAAIMNSVP